MVVLREWIGFIDQKAQFVGRDVNGTDNFRSESASASVFKDTVCTSTNPMDTNADMDFGQPDIRRIW